MRSLALLLVITACATPPTPIANTRGPDPAPVTAIAPVRSAPTAAAACPLGWDEFALAATPTIALQPMVPGQAMPEECPWDFDPSVALAHGCADCVSGTIAPGRRAVLAIAGPAGSGHFASLGLVVDGPQPRFACLLASTVGWRYLAPVAHRLSPLPWLADLDGDHLVELIAWQRLPWGNDEVSNALAPVVYALSGDTLVRRDDRGRALASKVGDAYAALAALPDDADAPRPKACFLAVEDALRHWGR
ncbi:MAG: hypothetical protein K8W52_38755 [Deltaproteobacteria bacterium]|nr:hypothetical protein [Deltaproteobacteria bacterium]